MDATFFMGQRTNFIRYFYDEGVKPFHEIKRKISDQEAPFDNYPALDDAEPAFLNEWMEADAAIDLVGLSCVSLLSEAIKLYFHTLSQRVIGFQFSKNERSLFKKHGFIIAYREALGEILDTDWSDCNADFDVIEQVVLVRNRAQHGGDLTSFLIQHDPKTVEKHPRPFFVNSAEAEMFQNPGSLASFSAPVLEISRELLFTAISEVESLMAYITQRLDKAAEWRQKQMKN